MGKLWVEVCLISARGLRRPSPSFLKHQWFAVAWIDPNNKYCSSMDASKTENPVWGSKFSTSIEDSNSQSRVLQVEVYSREPIFLREKLHGSAAVALKESVMKYKERTPGAEEVGSYQLRKKHSNKPKGFIDISIRVSGEEAALSSYLENDSDDKIRLSSPTTSGQIHLGAPTHQNFGPIQRPQTQQLPYVPTHQNPSLGGAPNYPPPRYSAQIPHPPPPPPPPSYAGYVPTIFPRPDSEYVNMAPSGSAGRGRGMGPALGVGMGAGAVAAGAVLFGDDYMSVFDMPSSSFSDPRLIVSIDPPF